MRRPFLITSVLMFVGLSLLGCKDAAKVSAQNAVSHARKLKGLAEADVGEIERGLPQGAERLSPLYESGQDPRQDLSLVRKTLAVIRRQVPDLNVAKSTFFALTDESGMGIRNDLEQDLMAGRNLAAVFPELAKAKAGAFVATTGTFDENTSDKDWVAASPVRTKDGTVRGLLVTGWSYRYFARHLHESLKRDLQDELRKTNDGDRMPIIYVGIFDRSGVYMAPHTPQINEKALRDLDLVQKTATSGAQGTLSITGRDFGYAAELISKLGGGTGVVVLRSEI